MSLPLINPSNKKFALIIGINYNGTDSQLSGCINDANHLKNFLTTKGGYLPSNILMLVDDNINSQPTRQNILEAFNTLISKATNEGFNELWISYSGHGSYVTDRNSDETDERDEVICPVDYSIAGMIVDDYIYDNFVCKLPATCTLFSLMDCCHSGTIYDLPYLYTTKLITNNTKNAHVAKVCSISGCRDDQTSADAYINNNYEGAMTWGFLNAMNNANYNIKLSDLCNRMRVLLSTEYTQVPQLAISSKDLFDQYLMAMDPISTDNAIIPITIEKAIKFKISADYWFDESTWNVFSVTDNKYLYSSFNVFTAKYQTTEVTKMLVPGTYKLVVKDTYGDGGVVYSVTDGLIVLASGKMTSGRLAEYTFNVNA